MIRHYPIWNKQRKKDKRTNEQSLSNLKKIVKPLTYKGLVFQKEREM
jgi:hypothetical protein